MFKFPDGFLWGASTASHQVEGNNKNNWSEWENSPKRLKQLEQSEEIQKYGIDNFISGQGANHFELYDQDFALAKSLGHTATRISIEWSRIEPEEGQLDHEAIKHYQDVVKSMRAYGLEPVVTIYHWPVPIWFDSDGGWLNRKAVDRFANYAEIVVKSLPEVKYWLTINEPEIFSSSSYLAGNWPPQKKSLSAYLRVFHRLIVAHKESYRRIKTINPETMVGIAKNNVFFEAGTFLDKPITALADWWWNKYFLNKIRNHQDFIGLNHYFHHRFFFGKKMNANKTVSDMGWELYPEAIYFVLKGLRQYDKPIIITENGLADKEDKHRAWFITESLKQVHRAISENVDVRGYLHWSLMDNFEWAEGYWPCFGLIEIDYQNLDRIPRPSAYIYKKICVDNAIFE